MTKEEEIKQLELEAAKIGMQCYESFYFFFLTFWDCISGEKFQDAPHIKYICDTLQYWGMKIINREKLMKTICISVPPGSSKSTIVTIAFTNWCWLHAPNLSTANISYSATLSQQHSYKARAITDSKKWHILFDNIFTVIHGKPLEIVKQNQTEMLNNFKGNRFCTSVGGTILGMHADIFCNDDLISAEQSKSDVERDKANRFSDETVSSRRKVPDCYLNIFISQRLHEDDSIGHILNKNLDITYICLPSEITDANIKNVSPPEAIELYTDGILDIKRRPKEVLNVLREEMGANGYAGQYLQVPFNIDEMDVTPSMFRYINKKELPNSIVWDVFIDAAYTDKKTENDPTGIDIIARWNNDIVVKESYSVWKKLPDLLKFLIELEEKGSFDKKKSRIYIEPKASGYSLAQYIESDTEYNYVLIGQDNKSQAKLVQAGKRARHEMIKPKAESRRIVLVEDKWNSEYVHEICGFPKVQHDERIDNLGYAINKFFMQESTFIEQWAITKLEKLVMGSIPILITSQQVKSRNGNFSKMEVDFEENNAGDTQLFDYPSTQYKNRYIVSVVMKSEAERGGSTCILVFDRMTSTVVSMFDADTINPRQIANKALELSYLFGEAKLVIAVKNTTGGAQNEEQDLGHLIIQEVRDTGYNWLYSRLKHNDIRKKREKEYGFEVTRSTSREIYLNLKDKIETNKISELPVEVFEDITILERRKEDGSIGAQEGKEINRALAFSIALKVNTEWSDKVMLKNSKKDKWT
jgi:phage terminase large subunit-like protein